jgi:CRP/FNR family transcriptional regulator, cyclic AMP receptor protein
LRSKRTKEEDEERGEQYETSLRSVARRRDDAVARRTKRGDIMKFRLKEQDRRAGLLGCSELFLGLTEEEFRKVSRRMEEKRFPRGATIFRKDDPSDSIFSLKEGVVKLVSRSAKGSETILYILRPTDIFGELLHVEERRPFDALAVTDVLAGVLSRGNFIELLSALPRVRLNFIRILSRRLVLIEKGVTEFSHTRSYHRLAKLLLHICAEHGVETPWGVMVRLSLTHADLANMIGTARGTVTIQLNRFRQMGLVWTHRSHLIVNRRRMTDYVQSGGIRHRGKWLRLDKVA